MLQLLVIFVISIPDLVKRSYLICYQECEILLCYDINQYFNKLMSQTNNTGTYCHQVQWDSSSTTHQFNNYYWERTIVRCNESWMTWKP